MLTRHCCIRVMKQALPLLARGHKVHLITEKVAQYADHCTTVTMYDSQDHLYESIKLHSDADIFHCHNEPSWFVTCCKETFWDKPVVLDVHDSFLLRRNPEELKENPEYYLVSADERNNIQLADGLVYVCDPMKEIVEREFEPKGKSIVLPSLVPERFYRIDYGRWWGGLVYEGRIDIDDELDDKWDFFQYSNYLPLAKAARELGIDFHVFTPRENEKVRKIYGDACFLHNGVRLNKLVQKLAGHDWGLVGNIRQFQEWKYALPNKLFEYMAGCVPIVSMYAEECSNWIKEFGVGITVETLEDLTKRWKEHEECRARVIKYRKEFAMERHIEKLEELYKGLT